MTVMEAGGLMCIGYDKEYLLYGRFWSPPSEQVDAVHALSYIFLIDLFDFTYFKLC